MMLDVQLHYCLLTLSSTLPTTYTGSTISNAISEHGNLLSSLLRTPQCRVSSWTRENEISGTTCIQISHPPNRTPLYTA